MPESTEGRNLLPGDGLSAMVRLSNRMSGGPDGRPETSTYGIGTPGNLTPYHRVQDRKPDQVASMQEYLSTLSRIRER